MLIGVQVLIGILFTYLGICSIFNLRHTDKKFRHLNMPKWFQYLTGVTQLVGGIALLVGLKSVTFGAFGGIWLGGMLVVGVILRIRVNDTFVSLIPALLILLGLGLISIKHMGTIFFMYF